MKYTSISTVCALLTASVSGFVSPSSSSVVSLRRIVCGIGIAHANDFCPTPTAPNRGPASLLKASQFGTIDGIIQDLLEASSFVYSFHDIRSIVTKNDGTTVKKRTGLFSFEEHKVIFDEPALVLTQGGGQDKDDDRFFKYVVTPAAIKLFIEKNRKYFEEPEGGGDWKFDRSITEKTEPFVLENQIVEVAKQNFKILDYDDEFAIDKGGFVYGVVINLTKRYIAVVFRGTIAAFGSPDVEADRNFHLADSLFKDGGDAFVSGGNPRTHQGFTQYLMQPKVGDADDRICLDRILACVNHALTRNDGPTAFKNFDLYVTGHSLGGGLANLFAFKAAQLKYKSDKKVKNFPDRITALTFAAPVVGNHDFNKEYQFLEKAGTLRHIRVANEGDVVPTAPIFFPASLALMGDTKEYTQNGVNIFLLPNEELVIDYRNTKSALSQARGPLGKDSLSTHMLAEYAKRINLPVNKDKYQQTVEELYLAAGDFTN